VLDEERSEADADVVVSGEDVPGAGVVALDVGDDAPGH
jgi:hypothetical protein